jgi:hypothetical protein
MAFVLDDWLAYYTVSSAAGVASSGATSLLGGGFRALDQAGGLAIPNVLPPFPMMVQSYYQAKASRSDFERVCLGHGINFQGSSYGFHWRNVLESMKPPTPPALLARLYAWERIDYGALRENFLRNNIVDDDAIEAARIGFGAPSWEWCLVQRRLGQIDDATWSILCAVHGVGRENYKQLWETSTSPLSLHDALDLWIRGLIDNTRASQHVAAAGIIANPDSEAVFKRAGYAGIPNADVLVQMLRMGILDKGVYDEWSMRAGFTNNLAEQIASHREIVIEPTRILEMLNRGLISPTRVEQHLNAGGYINDVDKDAIKSLRFHNPQVVEVVRYQRAFDANARAVKKLGLHDEYPASVAQAAVRTGWDQETISIGADAEGDVDTSPAKAEWMAHWIMPSPLDAVQSKLHLTPNRVGQLRAIGLDVETINDEELDGILQGNAVPPGWRDYVKASQYKQIPLREIIRVARYTKFSNDELIDRYKQLGYVPADAERMAGALEQYIKSLENHQINAEVGKVFTETVKQVKEAYEVGYLASAAAVESLIGIGFDRLQASRILDTVDRDKNHRIAVAGVKAIEQAFGRGELNALGVIAALTKIGIVNTAAQLYLRQWQLTHTTHAKHASTQEVLKWLEEGILTTVQAEIRLANLGWTSPDIVAMIADAHRQQSRLIGQATAAQSRDKKQKSAALASVAKQAAATHKVAISALKRAAGIRTLVKWWLDGLISEAVVEDRGQMIGYTLADIHRYINDALIAQTKKKASRLNAASTQSPANGASTPAAGTA